MVTIEPSQHRCTTRNNAYFNDSHAAIINEVSIQTIIFIHTYMVTIRIFEFFMRNYCYFQESIHTASSSSITCTALEWEHS